MSKEEILSIEKKLDRVLFYLNDDPATGKKGLVSNAESLDTKILALNKKVDVFINEYETDKKVKAAKIAAYASAGGGVALVGKYLISLLF